MKKGKEKRGKITLKKGKRPYKSIIWGYKLNKISRGVFRPPPLPSAVAPPHTYLSRKRVSNPIFFTLTFLSLREHRLNLTSKEYGH